MSFSELKIPTANLSGPVLYAHRNSYMTNRANNSRSSLLSALGIVLGGVTLLTLGVRGAHASRRNDGSPQYNPDLYLFPENDHVPTGHEENVYVLLAANHISGTDGMNVPVVVTTTEGLNFAGELTRTAITTATLGNCGYDPNKQTHTCYDFIEPVIDIPPIEMLEGTDTPQLICGSAEIPVTGENTSTCTELYPLWEKKFLPLILKQ